MDAYEFMQALRRQKLWLAVGSGVLVLLMLLLLIKVEDGRLVGRITPKYEASVRIAVVPEGVRSLDDPGLIVSGLAGLAEVYGVMLQSPEAILEIEERTSTNVLEMRVLTDSRSPIVEVYVNAGTPEGAVRAALGSFDWLSDRLAEPTTPTAVSVTSTTTTTTSAPLAEAEVPVVLDVEPVYPEVGLDTWLEINTFGGDGFAASLPRLVSGTTFGSLIRPGGSIEFVLGPETGEPYGTALAIVPVFPSDFDAGYSLRIRLRRGVITLPSADDPAIDGSRIQVEWVRTQVLPSDPPPQPEQAASLLLLTREPVAEAQGALRAPILVTGGLTTGLLALLLIVVARDRVEQARRQTLVRSLDQP